MIYPSELPLKEKVEECERRYAEQKFPCVFKLVENLSDATLDDMLEKRGYELVTSTTIMSMELSSQTFQKVDAVITEEPTDDWL